MLKISLLPHFSPKLTNSFENLHEDPYLKSYFKFRKRKYSCGKICNGKFYWNESDISFHQTIGINQYLGGLSRKYLPIDLDIREDVLKGIILSAYNQLPMANYEVGVHQIRILADTDNQGIPTPEGIHQDGFDYVTVTCVNSQNISGGITVLFDANDHKKITFEGILYPGMQIVFSDKSFAHYTSNITPKIPGVAFRDVVVTTFAMCQNH